MEEGGWWSVTVPPVVQVALNDIELAIENIQKLCASVQVSLVWVEWQCVGRRG